MKLKEKIVLLVLISLAGCIYCPAQDFDFYKKQAYKCFDDGEYEKAQKALNMYNEMTGNKITGLSEKVALCLNYQASAKKAEQSGDYASAKSYYESILECNPKDPNASVTIARLNKLIAALRGKERVVAGESSQPAQGAAAPELEFTVNGVSFKMVYVQGGTFTMGATEEQESDAYSDEKPVHQVTLSDYYIGKYEVTQGQWKAVMENNPSWFKKGDDYPVEYVSYYDVQEFLSELNRMTGKNFYLPTEAQWEFAARGGTKSQHYKYSGGNVMDYVGWYEGNSGSKTHPVGMKRPNELGIYDMSGNVWEWCLDWKGSYGSSSQRDPAGASSGFYRVLRGGSWNYFAGSCRVSYRDYYDPDGDGINYGFRLVLIP